jgi:ParB family chromosome partitioning protein
LNESLAEPYPDDLEITGAIVTVDHEGKLHIERSLIRREDMKKLSSNQGGATGIAGTSKGDEPKPLHSEKLTRMLTAHPPRPFRQNF